MIRQKKNNLDEHNVKARLLEAAISLFAEKGYASTSVREIVAKAGVTKPVLYYYFNNKEGTFKAILHWASEQQEAILAEVLERPGNAIDRIIYLYQRVYQGVLENKNLFKMIHNLIFGSPQGAPDYDFEQYQTRMVDAIKAIYTEALAQGEVSEENDEEVALLFLSVIHFSFHLDIASPKSLDPGRAERLFRLAFRGLAPGEDR